VTNRWSPGDSDWIRVLDYGNAAVWVLPEQDGATIAVYLSGGYVNDDNRAEIWTVRVRRGSTLLDTIMDKVHRVRWVRDQGSSDGSGVVSSLCGGFNVVSWDCREAPASHRGHPRENWNRRIWLDPLPRRVREAIDY
jgi:hypothetical protein